MRKFFTLFAATLISVSMMAKLVQEDIALDQASWGWGYNSTVTVNNGILHCSLTAPWGAASTGWDPVSDLSDWDKIIILVDNMSGCDGEWFKLKAYLRDSTESEANQMEGMLGLDAPNNQQNYLVIDLHQDKACDLTAAKILAIQCQPNGAEFNISRVYLEKEVEEGDYYLVGSMTGWQADSTYKFVANEAAAGEYMLLGVDLAKEDSIKVIGIDGETTTWYPDNAPNYGIAKDGTYNIYFRPDGQGGEDWYYHSFYVDEVVDETVIYVAFPTENRPQNISVAGTFEAGQWGMRIFNEPWFTCDEDLFTGKGDVLKFRDSDNADMVLCQFIPANGDVEGKWVQLLLYCKDYAVVEWKLEPTRVIEELDFSDAAQYAWKAGMPEPDPKESALENIWGNTNSVKRIVNGQLVIEHNGKFYNVLGAEMK